MLNGRGVAQQIDMVTLSGDVRLFAAGIARWSSRPGHVRHPNDSGVSPDGRYLYVNDVADLSSTGVLLSPMVLRRIQIRD